MMRENWATRQIQRRVEEGNLTSYFFMFEPTGNPHIDAILAAVAAAGKSSHSTEGWTWGWDWGNEDLTWIKVIQEMANQAAKQMDVIHPQKVAELSEEAETIGPADGIVSR